MVTHVWAENFADAAHGARIAGVPHVVDDPRDIIGHVDAVLIATDIGSEHVERAQPFIDAGIPVFIDTPLCDNHFDLQLFEPWRSEVKRLVSSSGTRYAEEFGKYRGGRCELEDLRFIGMTMSENWESYGIHALQAIYPIVGSGFESVQNTETA